VVEQINSVKHAPCVLLVDDDLAVRRAIKVLLETCNYEVREYSRAADLLSDAKARAECCLITDYCMPEVNGLELLRNLRNTGWLAPAILITAYLDRDLAQRAIAWGFYAVIEKPLTDLRLIRLLEECLGTPIAG
jgi:two-component system response regulator FixJ